MSRSGEKNTLNDETRQNSFWPGAVSLTTGGEIVLSQFRRREAVHAYLVSGMRGVGKAVFAKMLAAALFCEDEHAPCCHCEACRRVLEGNEPDVLTVAPQGGKQIGVDVVRDVIETVSRHAFGAGYRVVIIEPVEKMTPQAQNCLLKSLEEPAARVVFLLLAHEMTAILGTIASRCCRVKLSPWPDEAVGQTLLMRGYSQAEIAPVLPLCSGNIGDALELLEEKQDAQEQKTFVNRVLSMERDADAAAVAISLKDERDNAERYLIALEQCFHRMLLVCTKQLEPESLKGVPPVWIKAARHAPVRDWTSLLQAVFEARKRRTSQLNWQSTIDQLMMNILEARTGWQQSLE